jgi:hypothetical protein
MRKVLFFALLLLSVVSFSQAPQFLNYQGIARDAGGTIITTAIGVKFEILQGSASGTVVFDETNTITPSAAGIFTTAIGSGVPGIGTFSAINWATGLYFIRVNIDPAGGTSYSTVGTSQLLSVPYALYAEKAGNTQTVNITGPNVLGTYPNYTITPAGALTASTGISVSGGTITNTAPNQTVTISGATGTYPNFTVNSTSPTTITPGNSNISVTGASPNFTISSVPTLSLSGAQLSISNGNTVTLPTGTTYTNGAGIGITSGTIITNTAPNQTVTVASGTNVTVNGTYPNYTVNATPTLSLSTSVLSISGGNSVTLPVSPATTVAAGNNIVVNGTAPSYTVSSPTYSLNFANSSTGNLTNGISNTSVSLPQPTLTLSGVNSNIISAGSNSITIPNYVAGNGLQLSGSSPNFTLGATSTGTSAPWSTLGNTATNPGVNFLGTTDAQDLVFRTSNSQRVRIFNPSGFVGIGNLSAVTENLQVETGTNTALSILSGTNSSLYFGNTGNHFLGVIRYNNTNNTMSFWTSNTPDRLFIDATGRVGIGTPSPLAKLDISGGLTYFRPNATDLNKILVQDYIGSSMRLYTDALLGTPYDLIIGTFPNGHLNQIFLKQSNGFVGIRNNNPTSPLDVSGETQTDSIMISGPGTPAISAVLVSRDNLGNAKWAPSINFKGVFIPATPISVTTATQSNIGNTLGGYTSSIPFNNSPAGGIAFLSTGLRYTVPETGVYFLDASLMVAINASATGNNYITLEIFNSTTATVLQRVMQSNPDNTSTMNHVLHCSTTFNLTKNDIIILRVSGSTATAGTISNAFPLTDKMNSFSGFIIR